MICKKFKETVWLQKTFEIRKFLWFNYKKLVETKAIPTGLCADCNLPLESHNE